MRKRVWTLALGVAVTLLLAGCAPAGPHNSGPTGHLTLIPTATPSPGPSLDTATSLAVGVTEQIQVQVFAQTTFRAKHGCGCHLSKGARETFPAGTPVILLRVGVAGIWDSSTPYSQDVTGLNLDGTKFDGRPDLAVMAAQDGQKQATAAGLPWLPAGLFQGEQTWKVMNQKLSSFAVAYYVPEGVNQLKLTVNVPGQPSPNGSVTLGVPLPQAVIAMTIPNGGE